MALTTALRERSHGYFLFADEETEASVLLEESPQSHPGH